MTPTGSRPHTGCDDLGEHDLLRALAHVPDTTVPPVEGVHRRAAAIRRGRRRTKAGLSAGVLASALVIGGIFLPQSGDSTGPAPAPQAASLLGIARAQASDGAGSCLDTSGYTTRLTRQEWTSDPRSAQLAAWLPAEATGEPVRGIDVTSNRLTCPPPVPAAVLYAETPAKKGLTLWSDVARPFRGEEGLQQVQVRGTNAELLPLPGNVMLSWREPDGTRWIAQASGVDRADLLATLDGLALNGASLDPASVPASWQQSDLPEDSGDPNVLSWDVEYGPSGYTQDPPGIRLHVGYEVEPVAVAAARGVDVITFTRVNGHLATFSTDQGGCVDWDVNGLAYSVCGSQDMDLLVGLAEQVQHVATTDPRLQAAPDLYPTDDEATEDSVG
ncbi:hypothetical protein [Kineococcus arenarius]|uniref:hypothetical protein n=1 Tax=unclassified Kineococcus TaxID=2621656 RepID=UPI003D7CFC07